LTPPAGASPALLTAVRRARSFRSPEGQSDLDQIADAANRIAKSGSIALDNLNEVLSVENRIAFTQTLASVRDIAATVNARMDKLDDLTIALTRTAADVGKASRDVAEQVRSVQGAATPAVGQLEATLRDASRTLERVERESVAVAQRLDSAIEVGTLELGATSREIRATAEILARTVDRVGDPRTMLFGPPSNAQARQRLREHWRERQGGALAAPRPVRLRVVFGGDAAPTFFVWQDRARARRDAIRARCSSRRRPPRRSDTQQMCSRRRRHARLLSLAA
jgi:hypothetical protein